MIFICVFANTNNKAYARSAIIEDSVSINALNVHYTIRANAGRPVLVFIHGSPGSGGDFTKYLKDSLLATNYQLVAVDRPGFGVTGGPSMPSLQLQARAIAAVLQKFSGVAICLVGHSYGGPLAVQVAIDYPKLVQGLVLLAPALDPELEKEEWQRPLIKSRLGRWAMPMMIQNSNDELMTLKNDLLGMKARLFNVEVPVIHIHGTWDMFVNYKNLAFSENYFRNTPYLKTITLKRVNHFIPWTHFTLVRKELLSFESKIATP
jgi:pimeloyl-ACP methyl ester carboxylesterase